MEDHLLLDYTRLTTTPLLLATFCQHLSRVFTVFGATEDGNGVIYTFTIVGEERSTKGLFVRFEITKTKNKNIDILVIVH